MHHRGTVKASGCPALVAPELGLFSLFLLDLRAAVCLELVSHQITVMEAHQVKEQGQLSVKVRPA